MSIATTLARPSASYVFYWKRYHESISDGPDGRLSSDAHAIRDVAPGDVIWSFTGTKIGTFVLATRYVVDKVGENPEGDPDIDWGRRYAQSTLDNAIYFSLEGQPDITEIMVSIGMGRPGVNLGNSFNQAIRRINGTDQMLVDHARTLKIDPGLTRELAIQRWLSSLTATDEIESVTGLPLAKREVHLERVVRNPQLVTELKNLYGGRCQVTGQMPLGGLAGDITEVHHIVWLLRGGPDCRSNMVVLSPDMHAAIHATDACFDWSDLAFVMCGKRLPLALNHHLKPKR